MPTDQELSAKKVGSQMKIKLPGRTLSLQENPHGFKKGNKFSSAANMTPESHKRRLAGVYSAWGGRSKQCKEEKYVPVREEKRERTRLKETIRRESREIQDMASCIAEEAMERVANIIRDPDTRNSDVLSAVSLILDRAYGKAMQTTVNANIDANGKETDISTAELLKRAQEALNRIENITGGNPEAAESKDGPVDVREYDRDPDSSTKH